MSLRRKKITVRRKGKTFQRSVMVRAEAIGKRASGKKLNSLNPWETHHTEHVNTNTKLGVRQQGYGSSGPGSNHSAFALAAGQFKSQARAHFERGERYADFGTAEHSHLRRDAGMAATAMAWGQAYTERNQPRLPATMLGGVFGIPHQPAAQRISELSTAFGVPRSHVRRNYKGARFPGNW